MISIMTCPRCEREIPMEKEEHVFISIYYGECTCGLDWENHAKISITIKEHT